MAMLPGLMLPGLIRAGINTRRAGTRLHVNALSLSPVEQKLSAGRGSAQILPITGNMRQCSPRYQSRRTSLEKAQPG
ncbi:hypothetical protein FKM82_005647 [Ascaphus truei]